MTIEQAVYTAHGSSTGGRTGSTRSSDGVIDLKLTTPKELGGEGGNGANPEQLFACGYSACFIGAMKAVAAQEKIKLPENVSIDASVGIGSHANKPGAFSIEVAMKIKIPGMAKAEANKLIAAAHEVCPYSNATRGNIEVSLTLA